MKSKNPKIRITSNLEKDETLTELVQNFGRKLPKFIDEIEKAILHNEIDAAKTLLHKYAGTSSSYGFNEIAGLMNEIEKILLDNKKVDENLLEELIEIRIHLVNHYRK